MNEELKKAFELIKGNKEDKEVANELSKLAPEKSTEDYFKTIQESEEGKKLLNSFADKRVSSGVKTAIERFKEKELNEIVSSKLKEQEEELRTKYNPELTEAEKQLIETNKRLEQLEKREKMANSKNALLERFASEKIDTSFVDHFVSEDPDKSLEKASSFIEKFREAVKINAEQEVKSVFDKHGYDPNNPPKGGDNDGGGSGTVTEKQLVSAREKAMSLGTNEARAEYSLLKRKAEAQKQDN